MLKPLKSWVRRPAWMRIGLIGTLALVVAALFPGHAGSASGRSPSPLAASNELTGLPGHVHRLAQPRFDAGEAPSSLRMSGLELFIAKTPQQQRGLDQLVADQENPTSPRYHRWLTPAEYGERFGASEATLAALTHWLNANGLNAGSVSLSRAHLPFSGTKAQIEAAFHTQIRMYEVNGERHYANASAPQVPAALAMRIAAVRGLNDFHPRAGAKAMAAPPHTLTFYSGSNQYPGYVGPGDFTTMYDLEPAYQAGITGAGITVAIAGQSDVDPNVLLTFWSAFNVAGTRFGLPAQQFSSISVPAADGGADPGQTRDDNEDEAYLDTEIIGALAPGARLILIRDHSATLAAQYAVDQNLAAILNVSFGECEAAEGAANTAVNALWQQAAAQGITVTVSSGDTGISGCTALADRAKKNDVNSNGLAVNGLASTPFDLAVGGTDFDLTQESAYWNPSNQASNYNSAVSHIPEIVWNDSCADPILANAFGIFDPIAFCNTATLPGGSTANPFIDISGSGAGVSSCTSTDSGGNCNGGYAQPAWQVGFGVGPFGGRAIPDVSMIATRWLLCSYDTVPCDPSQPPTFPPAATGTIKVVQGTSAAAPAVAAIIAMLDQTLISPSLPDGRQGLVNPMLYQLAWSEYQNPAVEQACNGSQGSPNLSLCVFFDITAGSNAQPCKVSSYATASAKSRPVSICTTSGSDATGIIEFNGTQGYGTFLGLDIASGLGSINAGMLLNAVQSISSPPGGLSVSASGQTATLNWSADSAATGGYDIYEAVGSGGLSSTPIKQNVMGTSTTVSGLQYGQKYGFAIAAVAASGGSPPSSVVSVTIVPAAPSGFTASAANAGPGSIQLSWTSSSGANNYNLYQSTTSGAEGSTPVVRGMTGTSTTVHGLKAGQEYFFTLTAVDAGGESQPSAQSDATVIPAVPSGLTASAGNGTVSLSWTAATGATSYNVYQGRTSGGEGAAPVLKGVTAASASIAGLSNGAQVFFTVSASDGGGTSAASNEASATPAAPPSGGGGSVDGWDLALLTLLAMAPLSVRKRRRN